MSVPAATILRHLDAVAVERDRRAATPGLAARVDAVKAYQQRRFVRTYGDLLASERYGAAARFFVDELYGPSDFTRRDAQFARVVPALARVFPVDIVATVKVLAELHALSEALDTDMGAALATAKLDPIAYGRAWRTVGRREDRQRQIALTLEVASRLDRLTRNPLLRSSLRLMRGPARVAGLAELQAFLEAGFDTFRAMRGADEFIALVDAREQALSTALFGAAAGKPDSPAARPGAAALDALAALPPSG